VSVTHLIASNENAPVDAVRSSAASQRARVGRRRGKSQAVRKACVHSFVQQGRPRYDTGDKRRGVHGLALAIEVVRCPLHRQHLRAGCSGESPTPVGAVAELRLTAAPSPVSRIVRDLQLRKDGGSGGLRPRPKVVRGRSHSGAKAGD
jgi:hypothetical protein